MIAETWVLHFIPLLFYMAWMTMKDPWILMALLNGEWMVNYINIEGQFVAQPAAQKIKFYR